MKHSSGLTHLKDSQYLWHFLEKHEHPIANFTNYKTTVETSMEEIIEHFQRNYDIDIVPYLFTAHCSDKATFYRFILYLKKYLDIKTTHVHDEPNDTFVLHLLKQSECFEIMTILILFQYFFL